MRTKSVVLSVVFAVCVLLVYINVGRTSAPHASSSELQTIEIDAANFGSNFSPLPKDESGFTIKPPSGAIIQNPALDSAGKSRLKKQSPHSLLFESGSYNFKKAPISLILWTVSNAHKVKIVACFTPEKMREDPKVTMWLNGKTANEKLDKLGVLGLVWRKAGDTYYVAWNEKDLPPVAPTIVPAPQ